MTFPEPRRLAALPSAGRLQPHNTEAEESLLGAMLLSGNAITDAITTVSADDFYRPAHGHIYNACCDLFARSEPVDPVTVADELRRTGLLDSCGGSTALVTLQAGTPTTTNAAHYARIVAEHSALRRLVAAGGEIAELGYGTPVDVDTALDQAETVLYAATHRRSTTPTTTLTESLSATIDRLEMLYEGNQVAGTTTGYRDLDALTGGLHRGELTVIGARPAMGKSILGLGIASHIAIQQHEPVLLFSLEMSTHELTTRLLSSSASVDLTKFRQGNFNEADWQAITNAIGRISNASLNTNDSANLTIMELRAEARRTQQRHGTLGVIVVDYLQLMTGRNQETRQLEIAEVARGLKQLARELNVPIVALSQLSRSLEQRADKRPTLSDLRESGEIEQAADVVMFLYRDEIYHPETADKNIAEISIAKHRSGPTGTIRLAFQGNHVRFANLVA